MKQLFGIMVISMILLLAGCATVEKPMDSPVQEEAPAEQPELIEEIVTEPAEPVQEPAGVVVEGAAEEPTTEPVEEPTDSGSVQTYQGKELTGSRIRQDTKEGPVNKEKQYGQVRTVEGPNLDKGEVRTMIGKTYKFKDYPGLQYGQNIYFDVQLGDDKIYYAVNIEPEVEEQREPYRP